MVNTSVELRGTAELGNNSLWVCQYERPLSHTCSHLIHCWHENIDYGSFKNCHKMWPYLFSCPCQDFYTTILIQWIQDRIQYFYIINISLSVHLTCLHNLGSMRDRWGVSLPGEPRRQSEPPGALKDWSPSSMPSRRCWASTQSWNRCLHWNCKRTRGPEKMLKYTWIKNCIWIS